MVENIARKLYANISVSVYLGCTGPSKSGFSLSLPADIRSVNQNQRIFVTTKSAVNLADKPEYIFSTISNSLLCVNFFLGTGLTRPF